MKGSASPEKRVIAELPDRLVLSLYPFPGSSPAARSKSSSQFVHLFFTSCSFI
ncbi:hypothetical protein B4135_2533 [Caldibacillus debilis]|uniref:Uncharacterized protein n=1 Tax=Caldibacillus debilis TaxID=301148 RepID=A0A150LZG8_9BACI|nr:hypothetical protein B4135_2533 [Caldibacillus debilis]